MNRAPTRGMKTHAVAGIDNRGTKACPFGFVYFTDDGFVRVGYAANHGLFQANWGTCDMLHFRAAWDALCEQFPESFNGNLKVAGDRV